MALTGEGLLMEALHAGCNGGTVSWSAPLIIFDAVVTGRSTGKEPLVDVQEILATPIMVLAS